MNTNPPEFTDEELEAIATQTANEIEYEEEQKKVFQPLLAEFDGNRDQKGFHFRILNRIGKVCLLEKTNKQGRKFWEVIIIDGMPQKTWPDGRTTPAHEIMPSPEKWGVLAWSCRTLERAEEIFTREERKRKETQL